MSVFKFDIDDAKENNMNKLKHKLKQCIPYTIVSLPFMFWYSGIIVGQDTYSFKLITIGLLSFLHIAIFVMFYLTKKILDA